MSLLEKHIELVERVNNSKTETEHRHAEIFLRGFREALHTMNINQLMECDLHYMDQGIDRPMCCGVFLDWQPEESE